MGNANTGMQQIEWKFSTPLQANYLNSFIAGFSTPGLLTRPKMTPTTTSYGADVIIQPFSLLIVPEDFIPENAISESNVDENGEIILQKLVKITTTTQIKISITDNDVALGFTYSFANEEGSAISQWYGDVVALNASAVKDFKGIIIATCQSYKPQGEQRSFSIKTNGADISDFLLMKEGWNPKRWLSVISPRRINDGIYYNKLEVRTHNDAYKGYINGHDGLNLYKNLTYTFDTNIDLTLNPDGIRGFMPGNYNAFRLQTGVQIDSTETTMPATPRLNQTVLYIGETTASYTKGHVYKYDGTTWVDVTSSLGFKLSEYGDTLPLEKTSGGIFAMVDASIVNQQNYSSSFVNNLRILPVEQEDINIYYDNNVLFIR